MIRWRYISLLLTLFFNTYAQADSMAKYAAIARHIPEARMKANPKSQAWARSASSILEVTHETLAQTLVAMQQATAATHQSALFCLPALQTLDSAMVADILQKCVSEMTPAQAKRNISEVLVHWLQNHYPCSQPAVASITATPKRDA